MNSVRKRVPDRPDAYSQPGPLLGATSRRPTKKSINYIFRQLRLVRVSSPLVYFTIACTALTVYLLLQTPPGVRPPPVVARTTINSPVTSLPEPYGFGKRVMRRVLARVTKLVLSGARIDKRDLYDTADEQHMHGVLGIDPATGLPDWEPTPFDFSTETDLMKREAHTKLCFNRRRTDSLSLDRPIPDVRHGECPNEWYYDPALISDSSEEHRRSFLSWFALKSQPQTTRPKLPNTSVVIVFYNEPLSTLLRAVHSVFNRTPRQLLHEIILVDDGSDDDAPWLLEGAEFERHMQLLPKLRYARLVGRNGLMVARNVGASLATGDTITFLDSHIEVGPGWVEPLMGRIAEGLRDGIRRVVVPAIDSINADNFDYKAGGIDILGHTWGLGQTGIPYPEGKDSVHPIKSPIMAGGLLSVARKHFDELGYYDPEMQLWGGEEMEISFRIWLCGGTLECMPCSRVGHVFRSPKYWQGQVYKVPGEVISRNKKRASFWMDQYGQLVGLSAAPTDDIGPMDHYTEIKNRLQCKPYQWYLENVYTRMLESATQLIPSSSAKLGSAFLASGFLRNKAVDSCLDNLQFKGNGNPYGIYPCHYLRGSQSVVFTKTNLIMGGDLLIDGCLTRNMDGKLTQTTCLKELKEVQEWEMQQVGPDTNSMRIMGEGKCLTLTNKAEVENKSPYSLEMQECHDDKGSVQLWEWEILGSNSSST